MSLEPKIPNRFNDVPHDKPRVDRVEHANLERPSAKFHPQAGTWRSPANDRAAWRLS